MNPRGYNNLRNLDSSGLMPWMIRHQIKSVKVIDSTNSKLVTIPDNLITKRITEATAPLKDFRHKITFANLSRSNANKSLSLDVTLTNAGSEVWPSDYTGRLGIAVSYNINDFGFHKRLPLLYDVEPGKSITMAIRISELCQQETSIRFSMVQELIAWFHDKEPSSRYVIHLKK